MKKIFLVLVCLPILAFADDCANDYKAGLDLYKQGQYAEAQLKFIDVAKIRDYADVWNKIKNCNQKLSEKISQQASQITHLKKQLEQMPKKPNEPTLSNDSRRKEAEETIIKYKKQLGAKDSIITNLNRKLNEANANLEKQHNDIESLNKQIAEMRKPAPVFHEIKKEEINAKKTYLTKKIAYHNAAIKVIEKEKSKTIDPEKQKKLDQEKNYHNAAIKAIEKEKERLK